MDTYGYIVVVVLVMMTATVLMVVMLTCHRDFITWVYRAHEE